MYLLLIRATSGQRLGGLLAARPRKKPTHVTWETTRLLLDGAKHQWLSSNASWYTALTQANISLISFYFTHLERVVVVHRLWEAWVFWHISGCLFGKRELMSSSHHLLLMLRKEKKTTTTTTAGSLSADKMLRLFYFLNRNGRRCSRFIQSTGYPPLRLSYLSSAENN